MVSPAKLTLLKPDGFQRRMVDFHSPEATGDESHSLFSLSNFPFSTKSEVANYFVDKYSTPGEIVLDPFCGAGNISLAVALSGRIPYCSDIYPLALCMTHAKLHPSDITEVTLYLQSVNLKKPIVLDKSLKTLEEFFELDTLKELINLRKHLLSSNSAVARFLEVVAWSLLNGNSSSYFSAFTNPQICLSPEAQKQLNIERRQRPDYRAVLPRILKKTAQVTMDGIPSVLTRTSELSVFKVTDARNLSYLNKPLANMIMTSLPIPGQNFDPKDYWLKHWFSDLDTKLEADTSIYSDLSSWINFMHECLTEFARVILPGRYAVLRLRDLNMNAQTIDLSEKLLSMIESEMSFYWTPVELLSSQNTGVQLKNALKPRADSNRSLADRYLVLKRN